jgi:hypothetical protein
MLSLIGKINIILEEEKDSVVGFEPVTEFLPSAG